MKIIISLTIALSFVLVPAHAKTIKEELAVLNAARNFIYDETVKGTYPNTGWSLYTQIVNGIVERQSFLKQHSDDRFIIVNKSSYRLRLIENGVETVHEKVIVGRKSRPTPLFSEDMKYIVINPYWNVPAHLARADVLPKLRQMKPQKRLNYIHHKGYRFFVGDEELSPAYINWNHVPRGVRIKQDPGPYNSLGRIKFLFPNQYNVYIHDTPNKHLFNHSKRNYSSGCIRLQNPENLAAALLNKSPNKIREMINNTRKYHAKWIRLETTIPVHVVDWKVWVDNDGTVKYR